MVLLWRPSFLGAHLQPNKRLLDNYFNFVLVTWSNIEDRSNLLQKYIHFGRKTIVFLYVPHTNFRRYIHIDTISGQDKEVADGWNTIARTCRTVWLKSKLNCTYRLYSLDCGPLGSQTRHQVVLMHFDWSRQYKTNLLDPTLSVVRTLQTFGRLNISIFGT